MDKWFTSMQALRSNNHLYGSWVYGDQWQNQHIQPTSRTWDSSNVNDYAGPLYQFLRTGELKSDSRKYFDFYYAWVTHTMDVDRHHLDISISANAVRGDPVSKVAG